MSHKTFQPDKLAAFPWTCRWWNGRPVFCCLWLRARWLPLLLLLGLLPLFETTGFASDFQYALHGTTVWITGYSGAGGTVVIPESIEGFPVTTIDSFALASCSNLTSVVLPGSLETIAEYAFAWCPNLTSVTIPSKVTSVASEAFSACDRLIMIQVDAANTNYQSIDGVLFDKSAETLLTYPAGKCGDYVIPSSVKLVDDLAFMQCHGLTSVSTLYAPHSLLLSSELFLGCSSLTNVVLSKFTCLGWGVFTSCTNLLSITVDPLSPWYYTVDGVVLEREGNRLFQFPCGRGGSYTVPDGVSSVEDFAFARASRLTDIILPNTVTNIGRSAFRNCTGLVQITLPDGLAMIESEAFAFCEALTAVSIPGTVSQIEHGPFVGCSSLQTIVVSPSNLHYASVDNVLIDSQHHTLVQFPGGNGGTFVIPSDISNVESDAFVSCHRLTSVVVPASVTNLGIQAFAYCPALTGLYFEGAAPNLGISAFSEDLGLVIYHRLETVGWTNTYGGCLTMLWQTPMVYMDWIQSSGLHDRYPEATGKEDDPDGDGMTNLAEKLAGTDPTSRLSKLSLELVPRPSALAAEDQNPLPASQSALYFQSVPGRLYRIQAVNGLDQAWKTVMVVAATTTQKRVAVDRPSNVQFYRVCIVPE